ncbi:MAG: DUF4328 domain-containing protein [Limnobacter sp.]|nr:DUF4328 domain-containing protein [Limnobacter sp.]
MSTNENNFKDSSSLTNWVNYLLYAQIVVAVIAIGTNYFEYQLLSDLKNGLYSSQEQLISDAEASDQRQQIVGFGFIAVFIISGFLILRWIHRANYNARQLGATEMKFTPGWSIGYYFIPILALWKPYQSMKEIWKASHNPQNWKSEQSSYLLVTWWFLWIAVNVLGQALFRMSSSAEEIPELMSLNLVSQASEILSIPLALVMLFIVNEIHNAQMSAYESAKNAGRLSQA